MKTLKVGFGGGCHWCTEAVFQSIKGVVHVDQGWIAADGDNTDFSEAVVVTFDPELINLSTLIEIHTLTHSSTANHSMRKKYRSAVYVYNEKQKQNASEILAQIEHENDKKFVTRVLNFVAFKRNKTEFLNYYQTRPEAPFCQVHISPKLNRLRKRYNRQMK